ncbi:DUF3455 domain-containing protein [Novosphingobium terrae]|uniref:DUF3455 domain-containing protein n=1 Tax=Novosphingobium terrae TaxID=2726189 RepID=UPI00197D3879|nr:DUF3455 domain-containing protein [Novosphingobium terrae]
MPVSSLPALLGALSLPFSLQAASTATPPFDLAGRTVVATFQGEGAQIYACKAGPDGALTWTFREPVAALIESGKTVGRHFAGPRWELEDGSLVQGKMAQSQPGASVQDVPLLKLDVVSHEGHGRLDGVTAVYRLNTRGGVLQGACTTPGAMQSVPYAADYVFAW